MPTTLQKVMIGEELRTAIRLLKSGLRELNRISGANDFFHFPILLLASGFERFMKVIICCYHFEIKGESPKRNIFPEGKRGHDLIYLLDVITKRCFSDKYMAKIPAAQQDINFLGNNKQLRRIVQILSEFGQSARYYNLNIVLGEKNPGPSPDEEWQELEMEILKESPNWAESIKDPSKIGAIHKEINRKLTIHCEMLARSLSRLFTIGGLGNEAKRISSYTHDFLFLTDDQLGERDYEVISI
jgi:hypothetical protein